MNVGKAFSCPFQDEHWIGKIGIGAVLSLLAFLLILLALFSCFASFSYSP